MEATLAVLLPILKYAAGAGAGIIASQLFGWLRTRYAYPSGSSILDSVLHASRYARWSVLVLSALIALPAAALAALIEGQSVLQAADVVLAGFVAMVSSQLWHGQTLPTEPSK